ncbi:MAG: zinc-binding dehydrogenase [Candidatus Bipolaricaulota bacterium]
MKAVRLHTTGGADALQLEEVAAPEPKAGEAVVRLEAAALNHLDIWVRTGNVPVSTPRTLGCEGAGRVAKLGPGARGFREDQPVVVTPWLYPARSPRPNLNAGILGVSRDGCYAEQVAVPADALRPLPEGMSAVQGAAFPLVTSTAYHMLIGRGHLRPGETVLITGATGGVGTAAVQLARAAGARIIAASRSGAKAQRLQELGAHEVVDASADLAEQVLSLTQGYGVDLVAEQVGVAVWEACLAATKPGGRVVFCGATSGSQVSMNLQPTYRREISIHGVYGALPEELDRVWSLVESGQVQPLVDHTLPLDKAADAHRIMEQAAHFGKLVLTIQEREE